MTDAAQELRDYLFSNYGECQAPACGCIREGWHGRGCASWAPAGAGSWEELAAAGREIYLAPGARYGVERLTTDHKRRPP